MTLFVIFLKNGYFNFVSLVVFLIVNGVAFGTFFFFILDVSECLTLSEEEVEGNLP